MLKPLDSCTPGVVGVVEVAIVEVDTVATTAVDVVDTVVVTTTEVEIVVEIVTTEAVAADGRIQIGEITGIKGITVITKMR